MQTEIAISPTVAVRQDQFDASQAEKSVLCLEVSKDRFRFALLDQNRHCCWLEDYAFPSLLTERPASEALPALFQGNPILQISQWQEIRIAINSGSFTLVPGNLFRREYANSYLSLMRGNALPAHEFAQAYEHEEGFYSVFNAEHPLADYFSATYPLQQLTFVHQTSALIRAATAVDRELPSTQNLLLYFENEFITIILHSNRRLIYCNRFGYKQAQDLAYYILYVIAELNLEPYSVNALLYGEITPFADIYTELTRFLPHLSFGHTPPGLTLTAGFDDLPDHRYISLYGLALLPFNAGR
ncbi:DUF3822 family protein [Nibrella saemangeumensis]|uniref:DUF3822 family protein n=1 Tax=Nibrella saemangeumensis TaxID=1084526 RepID=A0ABP8NTC0_9BACT